MDRHLEQEIAQVVQATVDEPSVLAWYQGRARDRAHRALHVVATALRGGPWDPRTRRRAMAALADQAVARQFAEAQGATSRGASASRARPPLGSRRLLEVAVTERGKDATRRVHNALDAMRRGDLAWAPHVAEYLSLLTFDTRTPYERDQVRDLARWARDFTPVARQLADLDRAARR